MAAFVPTFHLNQSSTSSEASSSSAPGAPEIKMQEVEQPPPGSPPIWGEGEEHQDKGVKEKSTRKARREKVVDLDGGEELVVSHRKVKKKKTKTGKCILKLVSLDYMYQSSEGFLEMAANFKFFFKMSARILVHAPLTYIGM